MSQFLEVLEFLDPTGEQMVHRVPPEGSGETKFGAQCIVRDSQAAVFFQDGRGTDVLGPGRHSLSTQNLPILTKLLMLPWGFESFFKAEVYFVSRKIFTSLRWGTRDPVAFKDSELGMVRLRAFGAYTFQVSDPLLFINSLVGTQGVFTTDAIKDYLRDVTVSRLNDYLGENLDSILDLPRKYDEMASSVKARVEQDFSRYGLELRDFYINSITPPEEVQKVIDQRSGMGAAGDLDSFMKFRTAMAVGDAANNQGGMGTGLGLGAGAGLGMLIPGMLMGQSNAQPAAHCPSCGAQVPPSAHFCPSCGKPLSTEARCVKCEAALPQGSKFCPSCGAAMG